MSFKLSLFVIVTLFAASCVWGTDGSSHLTKRYPTQSQCGAWYRGYGLASSNVIAHVLTSEQSEALEAARVKRSTLERRITDGRPAFSIGGGKGACNVAYTQYDRKVCTWDGSQFTGPPLPSDRWPGWVSGSYPQNCGQAVTVYANGQKSHGHIAEACSFIGPFASASQGCSQIGITPAMMADLGCATCGTISLDSWDFDDQTFH